MAVVEQAKAARTGALSITIGTGCCESTAPFLYEDFWPGPDQAEIGAVAGVPVFAPEYLRALYPDDDGVVIDVVDVHAESLSIETEWGVRLILRGLGVDTGIDDACAVPGGGDEPRTAAGFDPTDPERPGAKVRGELPEALRTMVRIR
jgi:uncharacterized protein (DUF779 family)